MFKKGWQPTEERRENMRQALLQRIKAGFTNAGRKQTPEEIERRRQANLGKKRTPEQRLKMRLSMIGVPKPNAKGEKNHMWKGGYEHILMTHRHRRVQKLRNGGSHTLPEWEALKIKFQHICLCCKRQEPFINLTEDHIMPLSLGGTDNIDNIQPLCLSCNSRKKINTTDYRPFLTNVGLKPVK